MPVKKISELTASGALTGTEVVPVNQSGSTVRTTAAAIAALATGGGGGTPAVPVVTRRTGRWYGGRIVNGISDASIAAATGNLYASPYFTGAAETLDRIGIDVLTAGAGGATARLGIYNTTAGLPSTLLLDAGAVAVDSLGAKPITISQALAANSLYWLVVSFSAACNVRGSYSTPWLGVPALDSDGGVGQSGYGNAAYGALPASFGTYVDWNGVSHFVRVRLA